MGPGQFCSPGRGEGESSWSLQGHPWTQAGPAAGQRRQVSVSFTCSSRSHRSVAVEAAPSPCPAYGREAKHLPRVPPAGREPSAAARRNAPVVASALRPPDKLAICCCLSSAFVMQTQELVAADRLHTEEVGQFFPFFPPQAFVD